MTTVYPLFVSHKKNGDSFITSDMQLSSDFIKRITKFYADMNVTNPTKLIEDKYGEIVRKTIDTINSEGHDFVVSFNKKKTTAQYEILVLEKIESHIN
jgi:hypothetical protein